MKPLRLEKTVHFFQAVPQCYRVGIVGEQIVAELMLINDDAEYLKLRTVDCLGELPHEPIPGIHIHQKAEIARLLAQFTLMQDRHIVAEVTEF